MRIAQLEASIRHLVDSGNTQAWCDRGRGLRWLDASFTPGEAHLQSRNGKDMYWSRDKGHSPGPA